MWTSQAQTMAPSFAPSLAESPGLRPGSPAPPGPWIHSRGWDGVFIFATALLVALPFATYYGVAWWTGVAPQAFQHDQALGIAMLINLGAAFGIGGPHMYATYTMTLAESRFRQRHRALFLAAGVIPFLVVGLAIFRMELLLALFFGWASVHVIHQLVYLVQQYQLRAALPLPAWSRAIDYALATTCLFPLATWRLLASPGELITLPFGMELRAGFEIGRVNVADQVPAFLQGQTWIAGLVGAAFFVALALFLARTLWEWRRGCSVWPRTLLLLATVPVAFSLPMFRNLDVALQGFNLWHSAQYIGLVYLMNRYRRERGEISSEFVHWLSGRGRGLHYYAFVVTISVSAGGLMGILHYGFGLPLLQVYYCVLLSGLWVHYLWDHAVFTQLGALTPVAAPAGG